MLGEGVCERGTEVNTRVGTKDEEVSGGLRRLLNEHLHNLHFLSNIKSAASKGDEVIKKCGCMGEIKMQKYRKFVGKSERKRCENLGVCRRIILKLML